jgi:hypothetical protein
MGDRPAVAGGGEGSLVWIWQPVAAILVGSSGLVAVAVDPARDLGPSSSDLVGSSAVVAELVDLVPQTTDPASLSLRQCSGPTVVDPASNPPSPPQVAMSPLPTSSSGNGAALE